jgi:hypothetical protein
MNLNARRALFLEWISGVKANPTEQEIVELKKVDFNDLDDIINTLFSSPGQKAIIAKYAAPIADLENRKKRELIDFYKSKSNELKSTAQEKSWIIRPSASIPNARVLVFAKNKPNESGQMQLNDKEELITQVSPGHYQIGNDVKTNIYDIINEYARDRITLGKMRKVENTFDGYVNMYKGNAAVGGSNDLFYKNKYLKYKNKYLELKRTL